MTYRNEFPDFPPETMPAIPSGWVDTSWLQDPCPSFRCGDVRVWIDVVEPGLRFNPGQPRFVLMLNDDAGNDILLETDNWEEAVAFVEARSVTAFEALDLPCDVNSEADAALWNEAWNIAKRDHLS